MDESFLSALRIVAMMVGADGQLESREREWFVKLMNTYGIPREQLEIFIQDFSGKTPIEEIHKSITNEKDRERLLAWAKFAAQLDGKIHLKERAILNKIEELNKEAAPVFLEYSEYEKAREEQTRDVQMWQDLGEFGKFLNTPVHPKSYLLDSGIRRLFGDWGAFAFLIFSILGIFAFRYFFRI